MPYTCMYEYRCSVYPYEYICSHSASAAYLCYVLYNVAFDKASGGSLLDSDYHAVLSPISGLFGPPKLGVRTRVDVVDHIWHIHESR